MSHGSRRQGFTYVSERPLQCLSVLSDLPFVPGMAIQECGLLFYTASLVIVVANLYSVSKGPHAKSEFAFHTW